MKKRIVIIAIIVVVLIMIAIGIVWWTDYTKILEEPKYLGSIDDRKYSIEEKDDKVYVTIYLGKTPDGEQYHLLKNVSIYKFVDNKVSEMVYEKHYQNKLQANGYLKTVEDNIQNPKVRDNIIYGTWDVSKMNNITKEELIKAFETNYSVDERVEP